jgi:hypothetical protein
MEDEKESRVQPGLLIEVEIAYSSEAERLQFVIVPDQQADFAAGFLGESTPLAQAILGEPLGAEIPYFTGDARSVHILSVTTTERKPGEDAADRRQKKLRQAVEQSERTNAMIFASSFSGKWGDYDPNAIDGSEEKG